MCFCQHRLPTFLWTLWHPQQWPSTRLSPGQPPPTTPLTCLDPPTSNNPLYMALQHPNILCQQWWCPSPCSWQWQWWHQIQNLAPLQPLTLQSPWQQSFIPSILAIALQQQFIGSMIHSLQFSRQLITCLAAIIDNLSASILVHSPAHQTYWTLLRAHKTQPEFKIATYLASMPLPLHTVSIPLPPSPNQLPQTPLHLPLRQPQLLCLPQIPGPQPLPALTSTTLPRHNVSILHHENSHLGITL